MKFHVELTTRRVEFERFRQVYTSEDFNRTLMPAVKLAARELVDHETLDGGRELRRVKMVPDVKLPGVIKKLLGEHEIAYYEVTTYDPARHAADLHVESEAGDAVQVRGVVHFMTSGDGVRLRFDGEVHVRVPLLGGLIEKFIIKEVRARYVEVERHLQDYVNQNP